MVPQPSKWFRIEPLLTYASAHLAGWHRPERTWSIPMNVSFAICFLCLACSDLCANGSNKVCRDTLNIVFSAPLESTGRYELKLTGARTSSCSFENPVEREPDCPDEALILEHGDVVGLTVRGRIEGAVEFSILLDDQQLLREDVVPLYRRPASDCSEACASAQARVNTADLTVNAGSGGAGGQSGEAAGATSRQ